MPLFTTSSIWTEPSSLPILDVYQEGMLIPRDVSIENNRRTNVMKILQNKRKGWNAAKTKMCNNMPNCPYGDQCNFAHSLHEICKPKCLFGDVCHRGDECDYNHDCHNPAKKRHKYIDSGLFKTKMCAFAPNCKYGKSCIFAHSEEDLREYQEIIFPPIYKSVYDFVINDGHDTVE